MAVLQESPWYKEIKEEGRIEFLELERQEGRQEGRLQEKLFAIELDLEFKFGNEGLQFMSEISQISSLEKLQILQMGIKNVNTLDELQQLL